ncbi:protein of unknown function [Kyrpidia spormannii]|uniref:Uncharacterized protein n=2 Tax=Kyrpidia spormannii TaxID=2055160 RepID=A0ACA8Z860_9BACL|nr:protein of unknown function [Kyrpidia spormannii]CAB3392431.1 protein of unknown function [Kyrpidia spormannii]
MNYFPLPLDAAIAIHYTEIRTCPYRIKEMQRLLQPLIESRRRDWPDEARQPTPRLTIAGCQVLNPAKPMALREMRGPVQGPFRDAKGFFVLGD